MSVHIDGLLLGYMDQLEDQLKVGDQVTADLAANAAVETSGGPGQFYVHGTPGRYVARAVFKERALSKFYEAFLFPKLVKEKQNCFVLFGFYLCSFFFLFCWKG